MPADPLSSLVEELARLPGIGPKTARRLAHHVLRADRNRAEALATAIIDVKDRMIHCSTCHQITAVDPCSICSDPQRDQTKLCVVEEPFNIEPIERTGEFHGLYHALPGIKLFRSASMVIFLSGFAVSTLAAYGTDQVLSWARGAEPVPAEALRVNAG